MMMATSYRSLAWSAAIATVLTVTSWAASTASDPSLAPGASPTGGWRPIADLTPFAGATVLGLVSGDAGLLAVGGLSQADSQLPAAWTSPDGTAWTAAPAITSDDFGYLYRVVAGGPGYVALGAQCQSSECGLTTYWSSADGTAWTSAPNPDACPLHACQMNAIVAGPTDLVAVGSMYKSSPTDLDATVVVSTDGISWRQLPPQPSLAAARMGQVAAGGPGLVALGSLADGSFAIWTSPDGSTWDLAPSVPALAGGEARGLISTGSGLVAVGRDGGSAAVWTSADGLSWTQAPPTAGMSGAVMNAVTQVGPKLVAVGKDGTGAAAWSSPDGTTWSRLPSDDSYAGAEMTSVAASGSGVVATGRDRRSRVEVWVGPVP